MSPTLSFRFGSGIVRRWAGCLLVVAVSGADPESPPPKTADDAAVQRLIRQLGSEDFEEREKAIKDLVEIGAPALEALRRAAVSEDAEVARRAKGCLPEIERDVKVLAFAVRLTAKSAKERNGAALALYDFGQGAHKALPALIAALDDPDPVVRNTVVLALAALGPASEPVVPKLIRMLQDKSQGDSVRWSIAVSLGGRGPSGREAIPVLLHILETEGAQMQNGAANALGDLGKFDKRVIPALIKASEHESGKVNGAAAGALLNLAIEPDLCIPALVKYMKKHKGDREYDHARNYIAFGMGRFGAAAKPAIPFLIEMVTDMNESDRVRSGAVDGLANIGSEAKVAVPILRETLKTLPASGNHRLQGAIIDALDAFAKLR